MKKKHGSFPLRAAFIYALFGVPGLIVSIPLCAQARAVAAEEGWGLDYEGKAIVAVLPLAGDETEMIRRFWNGTMEAVAALQKYTPREVNLSAVVMAEVEIPTDMPPVRSLASGARYALTGGVYAGNRPGEHYLQLWLWDMAGSTMIYTDDLVYDDIEGAMESLPGLVEWLFSHIREVVVTETGTAAKPDPLFTLGVRFGPVPRWYVVPGEVSPGASALNLEGGVSGAVRINSLFSAQVEIIMTGDTVVYRGLDLIGRQYVLANEKFTNVSLTFPFLCKVNVWTGPVRLSPLAGFYFTAPLGQARYSYSPGGENSSRSWSFSVPMGFTAGLEGAVQYGPGRIFGGIRYAGDFGTVSITGYRGISFRRHAVSLYLGYEFGFLDGKKIETFFGELF
ncbi:MAG: hypothetical protein LBK08_09390 [Treponema sp.]|jgi:hypothetical protein|nr:hypothetical protein [Treponema sp.]